MASEEGRKAPNYMAVWAGLAVLTAVEVGIVYLGFTRNLLVLTLVALAVWKALLVAMYFMHLKFEPKAVSIVAMSPLLPAAILIILVLFENFG
jgi:cytochrome c oxidase subunit 4